jgi:DNA modification methylase
MASKIAIKNRIKELRYVTAQELEPHPLQHRLHPDKQKQALDAALREIGIADALLAYEVDGKLRLIDGHGRREVAPDTKWPVLVLDVNDAEAKQILAQHDALAGLAEIDAGALDALLREVSSGEEALQALFAEMATDAGLYQDDKPGKGGDDFDVDAAMPQGETRSKLGDIWQCGKHRILCGDSTDAAQVARLMQGEKVQLILTSPPYGVGMEYEEAIPDFTKTVELVTKVLKNSAQCVEANGFAFVNFGDRWTFPKVMGQVYLEIFQSVGWRWYDFRVWKRSSVGMAIWNTTQPHAMSDLESLYTFQNGKGSYPVHNLAISKLSVWEAEGSSAGMGHPAVMSLGIAENAVAIYTKQDNQVLDPFLGSGTTLIACERTNRQCRGIELEPRYVDMILARYEAETGQQAQLLDRIEQS